MEYAKQGHSVYYCRYHIVITSKYRRNIFVPGVKEYMLKLVKRVSRYYPEVKFIKINGEPDHFLLLVSAPPKMPVSQLVRIIKSNTARELRKKFPFLKKVYWGNDGIWSTGYFVSTVGVNESIIKQYIEQQGQEDIGQEIVMG